MFSPCNQFMMHKTDKIAVEKSFNPPSSFTPTVPDKYGKQNTTTQKIFNEKCVKGVELVAQTIRKLREQPLTLVIVKQVLSKLLEQLAAIRYDIAIETKTRGPEVFGRPRKTRPLKLPDGVKELNVTKIDTKQHWAAHEAVKRLLEKYLRQQSEFKRTGHVLQAIAKDDNPSNSRYVITIYEQARVIIDDASGKRVETIDTANIDQETLLKIQRFLNNPQYCVLSEYDCPDWAVTELSRQQGQTYHMSRLSIVVGEIQIGDQHIPATKHVTWMSGDIDNFMLHSKIWLHHTSIEHHDFFMNKLAESWLAALQWDEQKDDLAILHVTMADLQFYFAQPLFFYRGSPTISKMLLRGTYCEQGFLPAATVSEIDEYCTAEYFPFLKQLRAKFLKCFEGGSPVASRTREFSEKQGRFAIDGKQQEKSNAGCVTIFKPC